MKQVATIEISVALVREWLKLPDDVEVLGFTAHSQPSDVVRLMIETPEKHIKGPNLIKAQYRRDDNGVHFDGFTR